LKIEVRANREQQRTDRLMTGLAEPVKPPTEQKLHVLLVQKLELGWCHRSLLVDSGEYSH